MGFIDELHTGTNKTARTANGAVSNNSTLDPVLDFFSNAGAMRGREADAVNLFRTAFAADQLTAIRCLFYLRDVRGGQGERSVFNAILNQLNPTILAKVVKYIPEYGRWDEVPISKHTYPYIKEQLAKDEADMEAGKSISLLAKWLPSENASNHAERNQAESLAAFLDLKPRQYRKKLTALRTYLDILEQKMSANRWDEIDFSKLPTQAHRKHIKAFKRHVPEKYEQYIGKVEKGEAKINSNTAFTYEIYDMVKGWGVDDTTIRSADAMWKALPDYTNGANALVLADVSGSMSGRPMSISTSLAVYFAERNKGPFHNLYMTFTDVPRLVQVQGATIKDKLSFIEGTHVGYNTNLHAAFRAILNAAKRANASQDELPQVLYIISDMQFDAQMGQCDETNFDTAQREFAEAGYQLPHVVFWNCNAFGNDAPATKYDDRVTLISGSSQSTFKYAVAGKNPLQSMLDILNSERYAQITL